MKLTAVQEALAIWAASFAAIVLTFVVAPGYAKLTATVSFLYFPLWAIRRRDEDHREYGLWFGRWRKDVRLFLALSGVVLPLFVIGFIVYPRVLSAMPAWISRHLSPLSGALSFSFRLPDRFGEWTVDQLFVVALPEEFFYRGFIQTRLRDAWPQGPRLFGVRVGPAFWLTAVLFALGHLAIFQVWRLGVFFPALLFGWLREKTGSVVGASLFHATCNLVELILEASFFGHV